MALMQFTLGLVLLNIIVLLWIIVIHARNFREIKSSFTCGLLIFTSVFLIENLVAAYFYLTMMPYYADGLEFPVLLLTSLQTIAFVVFLYVTRK